MSRAALLSMLPAKYEYQPAGVCTQAQYPRADGRRDPRRRAPPAPHSARRTHSTHSGTHRTRLHRGAATRANDLYAQFATRPMTGTRRAQTVSRARHGTTLIYEARRNSGSSSARMSECRAFASYATERSPLAARRSAVISWHRSRATSPSTWRARTCEAHQKLVSSRDTSRYHREQRAVGFRARLWSHSDP